MVNFSTSSAIRGLSVLELLVEHRGGLQISDIALQLSLPLGATHRLLQALVEEGYVKRDEYSDRYQPSLKLGALGIRLIAGIDFAEAAQPILDELARQTGELVRLAMVDAGKMTWIAKAQGATGAIRCDPILGRDVPLHTTAMGKDWLANMPEEEAVALVLKNGFDSGLLGPNAVRTVDELRASIAESRAQGYSLNDQESELGLVAIGKVVFDRSQTPKVIGAISIAGPIFRVDRHSILKFAPLLKRAAEQLTQYQISGFTANTDVAE
jgi:IclR family acetate operon transcriptional repressor